MSRQRRRRMTAPSATSNATSMAPSCPMGSTMTRRRTSMTASTRPDIVAPPAALMYRVEDQCGEGLWQDDAAIMARYGSESPRSRLWVLEVPGNVGGQGGEFRIRDLGLAKGRHQQDPLAHEYRDGLRCKVGPLQQYGRQLPAILNLQRLRARMTRSRCVAGRTPVLID